MLWIQLDSTQRRGLEKEARLTKTSKLQYQDSDLGRTLYLIQNTVFVTIPYRDLVASQIDNIAIL